MGDQEEIQGKIINWVVHNIQALQLKCKDFVIQRDQQLLIQPKELHQDVIKQFEDLCRSKICEEIGSKLGVDPMQAAITIEKLNITEFFKT